jgi:hypothetical protein
METESLIDRIARVFPVAPIPDQGAILYEGAYRGESELEEIKAFFGGRAWNSITPRDVFRFRHALSFFSPTTFAYFSAAWMTCSLMDEGAVDTAIDNLVATLAEADPDLWTPGQRSVICAWLDHFDTVDLPSAKSHFESALRHLGCAVGRHRLAG